MENNINHYFYRNNGYETDLLKKHPTRWVGCFIITSVLFADQDLLAPDQLGQLNSYNRFCQLA